MRYIQSQNNFRQNQPKKNRLSVFLSKQPSRDPGIRYNNPYLKPKKHRIKIPFKTIGVIMLIFSWLGLMVYLPYFRISKTSITGLKIIKQNEISDVLNTYLTPHKWWPDNNYFLVREEGVKKFLSSRFSVSNIEVHKIFPDTLEVVVEEKISSIVYDNGRGYFLLDQDGSVIKILRQTGDREAATTTPTTTPVISLVKIATTTTSTSTGQFPTSTPHIPDLKFLQAEYSDYPIIYDEREPSIRDSQANILNDTFIKGVIELYNAFKHANIGKAKYVTMNEANAGVTMVLDKPWKIRFQPTHNISEQIENVKLILKQNHPAEYIDVRFNERVFWK